MRFENAVQEVFAVEVLGRSRFPDLINDDPEIIASTFDLSEETLIQVPQELRG